MDHYVKPTLSKNPKEVIIHAGTNNIPRDEPACMRILQVRLPN
jgi:hypothetical protein